MVFHTFLKLPASKKPFGPPQPVVDETGHLPGIAGLLKQLGSQGLVRDATSFTKSGRYAAYQDATNAKPIVMEICRRIIFIRFRRQTFGRPIDTMTYSQYTNNPHPPLKCLFERLV